MSGDPANGGLVAQAEVDRGAFTLRAAVSAAPGEVLAVLGPNGSGKSTLLGAVAGLTPLSGGRISLDAAVLDDADDGTFVEAAQRPVGFVFQDYRLFPHLSVLDNVAFSPRVRGLGRARSRAVAVEWLERLGPRRPGASPPGRPVRGAGPAGGPGPCPGR